MATDRPLVVLAGPIHPAGRANLETEARVVVCDINKSAAEETVALVEKAGGQALAAVGDDATRYELFGAGGGATLAAERESLAK